MGFCLQLLQFCYITVLWIYGMSTLLLVVCRGGIGFLPTDTAVLLHYLAMDAWTASNILITGWSGNMCSLCSYCSSVTSQSNEYRD